MVIRIQIERFPINNARTRYVIVFVIFFYYRFRVDVKCRDPRLTRILCYSISKRSYEIYDTFARGFFLICRIRRRIYPLYNIQIYRRYILEFFNK